MNNQTRRRYVDPIIYTVGKDISEERYADVLGKITDWFVESRLTNEPGLLAKQLMAECLEGKKADGTPWFGAANSTLAARVKIKCRYDIEKMKPLRNAEEKRKQKKLREREALREKRRSGEDPLVPEEIRKSMKENASYGDSPTIWMTTTEQGLWNSLYDSYKSEHPELSAMSAMAELKMLCDTHILMERFRVKELSNQRVDPEVLENTVKRFTNLKKSLGIHPDQLKKKTKDAFDASIGEAVAKWDSTNYKEMRERFWIEELIQIYQMYHTPRADGVGYQLDDVGLFGMTRSKPEPCPNCGTMVFAGLTIQEIEEYLVRKGAIEEVEEVVDEKPIRFIEGTGETAEYPGRGENRDGEDSSGTGEVAELPGSSTDLP